MHNNPNINIKSKIAFVLFICFWCFTFIYVITKKQFEKKIPKLSWTYSTIFPQHWSFFSQPAIYNDKLIVLLKNQNDEIVDSVDVLKILHQQKRNTLSYSRANVWDHILYRRILKIRNGIKDSSIISYNDEDIFKQIKYYELLSSKQNDIVMNNIEEFEKEMLITKKIDSSVVNYQTILQTKYIAPFKNTKPYNTDTTVFVSNWATLNN